jgi:hypothetical protein
MEKIILEDDKYEGLEGLSLLLRNMIDCLNELMDNIHKIDKELEMIKKTV